MDTLYTNKFALWAAVIVFFVGAITLTLVLYWSILAIINNFRSKKREKVINALKERLSDYEFESTQENATNKSFDFFRYLYAGDLVRVIKPFKDYYGFTHYKGEQWYFACAYFLPYDNGYTLLVSADKSTVGSIFLQDREESQSEICTNPEKYFKVLTMGRIQRIA